MTSEQIAILRLASSGNVRPVRGYNLSEPDASAALAYCATIADVLLEQQQQIDRLTKLVEQMKGSRDER